jgi:hypothetical protein
MEHKATVKKLSDLYPYLQQAGYPHTLTAIYSLKRLRHAAVALRLLPAETKRPRKLARGFKTKDGDLEAFDDSSDDAA